MVEDGYFILPKVCYIESLYKMIGLYLLIYRKYKETIRF